MYAKNPTEGLAHDRHLVNGYCRCCLNLHVVPPCSPSIILGPCAFLLGSASPTPSPPVELLGSAISSVSVHLRVRITRCFSLCVTLSYIISQDHLLWDQPLWEGSCFSLSCLLNREACLSCLRLRQSEVATRALGLGSECVCSVAA